MTQKCTIVAPMLRKICNAETTLIDIVQFNSIKKWKYSNGTSEVQMYLVTFHCSIVLLFYVLCFSCKPASMTVTKGCGGLLCQHTRWPAVSCGMCCTIYSSIRITNSHRRIIRTLFIWWCYVQGHHQLLPSCAKAA